MANWTLLQARERVKFFLRPVNAQFYRDTNNSEAPVTDFLNEGIADMTCLKAPYMLWDNHDVPCSNVKLLMLDDDMLSVKRVEYMETETDENPRTLLRPEDYDIHETYLEFTEAQTGVIRILATRKPSLLVNDTDLMPFGSPFQLGVVFYAVATLALSGGNAGVALSGQYMAYYERIKSMWERQTFNEATYLRGQDSSPVNDVGIDSDIPEGETDA
jgi:hypothetical protein